MGAFLTIFIGLQNFGAIASNGETTMEYRDVVAVHADACRYVELTWASGTVAAPWPLAQCLDQPFFSYVRSPVQVIAPGSLATGCTARVYAVLVPRLIDKTSLEFLRQLIDKLGFKPVKRFENHRESVEVYADPRVWASEPSVARTVCR